MDFAPTCVATSSDSNPGDLTAGGRGATVGFVDAYIGFAVGTADKSNDVDQEQTLFPVDHTVDGILTLFRRVPPTSTRDADINAALAS